MVLPQAQYLMALQALLFRQTESLQDLFLREKMEQLQAGMVVQLLLLSPTDLMSKRFIKGWLWPMTAPEIFYMQRILKEVKLMFLTALLLTSLISHFKIREFQVIMVRSTSGTFRVSYLLLTRNIKHRIIWMMRQDPATAILIFSALREYY